MGYNPSQVVGDGTELDETAQHVSESTSAALTLAVPPVSVATAATEPKTPLTYGDAITLGIRAEYDVTDPRVVDLLYENAIRSRTLDSHDRIARALMLVDTASRRQAMAGQRALLEDVQAILNNVAARAEAEADVDVDSDGRRTNAAASLLGDLRGGDFGGGLLDRVSEAIEALR